MSSKKDVKAQAQARFGQYAQDYVDSKSHAAGADLERLVALAAPQADWIALDVATGGGHTALKIAPHVRQVVAVDLTPKMLAAAHTFIEAQAVDNVVFAAGDAEQLPFAPASFELVTCRIAPHHFSRRAFGSGLSAQTEGDWDVFVAFRKAAFRGLRSWNSSPETCKC